MLETGAGNSTIALMHLNPRRLVSIAPDRELFERIRQYCANTRIDVSALEAHVERSEWVLPQMALAAKSSGPLFDFALIDGCHNWPMVFVDFMFVNHMLKPGGYLMIDDLQLHSVKELARLLSEQPEFEPALDLGKSMIFRRKSEAGQVLGEWVAVPYIVRKSQEYASSANPFAL
jgi:hypothetical protein